MTQTAGHLEQPNPSRAASHRRWRSWCARALAVAVMAATPVLSSAQTRQTPLLEQLSPTFELDYARLAWFLGHVPAGRRVAVELRLRAHARPRPAPPLRRVVFRCGPALVGHRIREWGQQGRDVYVYFNNDGEGNAVRNAATLRRILGDA